MSGVLRYALYLTPATPQRNAMMVAAPTKTMASAVPYKIPLGDASNTHVTERPLSVRGLLGSNLQPVRNQRNASRRSDEQPAKAQAKPAANGQLSHNDANVEDTVES